MSRPEHLAPPEIYYNEQEAKKYTENNRMIDIQEQLAGRALEMLLLPEDTSCFLLDIGCGSGLSGTVLDADGHIWVGLDISTAMLDVAKYYDVGGDLMLADMGQGCPFKAGSFDGAISISALQWLCNADKKSHNPVQRLYKFFSTLYACLKISARVVLQFYPENSDQIELITNQAMKAGFFGGVVVDYPNSTKAKKFYLCLTVGQTAVLPKALGTDTAANDATVSYSSKRWKVRGKSLKNRRDWILDKKERRRKHGKETRADSKYTGRRRCGRF